MTDLESQRGTVRSNSGLPRMDSCQGLDTVERDGNFEGVRVRVYLWNKEEKVLFFKNYDLTAQQVCDEMAKKQLLTQDSKSLFSLWIIGNDLELQLKSNQDLFEIVEKFPRYVEKYTHYTGPVDWRFHYKREALLPKEDDRKVKDPSAIKLLYSEALYNVLYSRFPCEEEEAINLAALQMQIVYGDYDPEVHKPDFLVNKKFKGYFPKHILERVPILTSKSKYAEWEEKIFKEYERHSGKPETIVELLYLQFVRQWNYYGSTFFIATSTVPPKGYFEHRTDTLYVAVNAEGIHVIQSEKYKLLHSFFYDEINWDANKDSLLIEYGPEDNPSLLTLITPQATLIASLVSKAIKNLDKKDEK